MIKFMGFLPDLDPTTSGIFKDCSNVIPTIKGFRGAYSAVNAGLTAASEAANSLVVVEKLNGDRRTFAGTTTTIEEVGSGSWTDRSGATYNCGSDSRWSFAQFGNYTLAANKGDVTQVSESAAFAAISGAPQAAHIAVSDGFAMVANTTTSSDGWHCCAYLDHTDWTEAVSTQCTSGRLLGGGAITGLKKFGSGFVAFKKNKIHLATYVGAPVVFQWDEIPGDIGCESNYACVDVQDRLFFLGNDDFYAFDGARPVSIGEGIREWFFEDADPSYLFRTMATYNPITGNVTWHYCSTSASGDTPNKAVVYNTRSGRWGKFSISVEAVANYYPSGVTYHGLGSLYSTYDDLPTDISFDSPYWTAGTASAGVIKTDHILYTLTGTAGETSITINTIGNDELFTTIQRVRPRFLTPPQSATLTYSYDNLYGDSFAEKDTYNLNNGKFDLLHSSRWHEFKFNFNGNMEIIGADFTMTMDGSE